MDHYHLIGAGQFNHAHSDAGHAHTYTNPAAANVGAVGTGILVESGTANTGVGYAAIQAATLPQGNTVYASQTNGAWVNTTTVNGGAIASGTAGADRDLTTGLGYAAISTVSAGAISVSNSGSGTAHNNMQPSIVLNRIIKT
jgi:microcystin-dependent protein